MKICRFLFPLAYLFFQILTRIILSIYALYHNQITLGQLPAIFTTGLLNDFISLSYFMPIILLLTSLFKLLLGKTRTPALSILSLGYFITISGLIFNLMAEITFWDEFSTRYNFIAVDYLIYTQEIIGTIIESMPIIPIIAIIIIFSSLITIVIIKFVQKNCYENNSFNQLIKNFISYSLIALVAFKFYDSEKFTLTRNIYAQELGKNGPYEFFSAFRNNSLDYLKFYPGINQNIAMAKVREEVLQQNQKFLSADNIERETFATNSGNDKKPNIILITIESLSAEYMAAFGSGNNITPNLDKLSSKSLFFTNLYAAGTRTVRGLEALSLGVPPTPGSSILRRVNNNNLFNIATPLKDQGYNTTFLFGGMSYFDNLDNFFSNNDYKVIDRTSLTSDEITFSNVWGVADEDLFNKALSEADNAFASSRPFFSFIMTTNNHRPYTFPDGKIDLPSGSGRKAAVKYTDYAVGKFIEDAKSKPWFDNTIFIITADHCASSAGKTHLPVNKYHIPMIIYAPKIIKPQKIENLTSQIDIPPTVLGLLNINYKSKFMGKDVLLSPSNRAFIGTYQMLGYMKDNHLVILAPKMGAKVYKLQNNEQIEVHDKNDLIHEAISFYQVAYTNFIQGKMKQ